MCSGAWTCDVVWRLWLVPRMLPPTSASEFPFKSVRPLWRWQLLRKDHLSIVFTSWITAFGVETTKTGRGVLRTLPFELNGFSHVLSIKASRDEHINMLESHAFLLLVRWLLRRTDLQATRIVLLCDSSVWKKCQDQREVFNQSQLCVATLCSFGVAGWHRCVRTTCSVC